MKVTYLNEKIIKKGSNYQVQSEKGKNMGTYKTKEEAMERLRQIESHKYNKLNEDVNVDELINNLRFATVYDSEVEVVDDWEVGKDILAEYFALNEDTGEWEEVAHLLVRVYDEEERKGICFREIWVDEPYLHYGIADKLVKACLDSIDKSDLVLVHFDLSGGFWSHMKKKYPQYNWDKDIVDEKLEEDTKKKRNGKWVNKGKEGEHGEFKTKKAADAQRRAMFANGYSEDLNRINEATVKKQSELKNTHIPHMNQFIADGKEGLERFNDFISSFINVLETGKKDDNITLTNKKDGAPCLLLLSHMEGYPDNSVGIKSMISNPANAYSSYEEIEEKANPNIQLMLKYALDMAHCIPEGEMWQGDCLFVEGGEEKGKSIQNINNKEYLIYKPNTIVYGHEKGSKDYNKVEKSKFGIAFHTIHKGQPGDLKQSFKIDLSRLKGVPEDYYVTKTELDYSTDKTHYDFEGIKKTYNELVELENKLINDPSFEELVNNAKFRKYWDMFENKTVSSEAKYINPQTFIKDLKEFINGKIQGYFDKGRISQNVRDRDLKELEELVENNKDMLLNYIGVVNKATDLDNLIIRGLEKDVTVDSFIVDDQGNYIYYKPGEGFVLSKGGLSGKFVDRDVFSKLNRFGSVSQAKATESLREEVKDKIALVTMGKYNPITIGHLEQINYMLDNYDGDVFWFFSGKQDNKNHPLSSEENVKFANHLVGDNPRVKVLAGSNPFQALSYIYNLGYKNVIYVVGEDRYTQMKSYLERYKQDDGTYNCPEPTHFVFDNLEVVLSGNRHEGISGTDARNLARSGKFEQFKKILPFNEEDSREIYDIIRERMGVIEDEEFSPIIRDLVECGSMKIRNSILIEATDPFYNNVFKVVKPLIEDKLKTELNLGQVVLSQDRSDHPFEIFRIGNSINSGGNYSEEELKSAVENSINNLIGEEIITKEGVLVLRSINDYSIHGGEKASGTFKSFRVFGDIDDKQIVFYITVKSGKNSNIKAFTPNKVLDIVQGRMHYTDVSPKLKSVGSPELNNLLTTLITEAGKKDNVKFSGNLLSGIGYVKGEENSTNPGEILINFSAKESSKLFNNLDIDPQIKSSIESTINTDLTEVVGAVAISNALSQALGRNDIYIEYPIKSNEKLIDYYIYAASDKRIKVSAKKDSGGKPSSTGLIDIIIDNNKEQDHIMEFVRWFRREHIGMPGTAGHKSVADKLAEIIEKEPNMGWEWNVSEFIKTSKKGSILKIAAEAYRKLQDPNVEPTDNLIRTLADTANEYLSDLRSRSLIGEIYPKGKEINYDKFIRNKAVFCMCKIFVNIINASGLMRGLNKKFSDSFGGFIQVYCNSPKLSQGNFIFKMVFTSMDGQQLEANTKLPEYKLVEDCANTPPDGEMTIKKIAMVLDH